MVLHILSINRALEIYVVVAQGIGRLTLGFWVAQTKFAQQCLEKTKKSLVGVFANVFEMIGLNE